jgi:hypothetical protein
MNALRVRALTLSLLAALAAPAFASEADPPSETPIGLVVGQHFKIKLKSGAPCTFDFTAVAANPAVVGVAPSSDTGVKSAVVELIALEPGSTSLTITSSGGSCEPSLATYEVSVQADMSAIVDAVNDAAKAELKEFKQSVKSSFASYKQSNADLVGQVKDGTIEPDALQDAFHANALALRQTIFVAATQAYTNVIAAGTTLLFENGIQSVAPQELFAGGGGSFDTFQNGVCAVLADFRSDFDKAERQAADKLEKAGSLRLSQWTGLPPLYASGPYYPTQLGVYGLPQPHIAPLTWTLRPTTNVTHNDGRLLVSGRAMTGSKSAFHVTLTREATGAPPVVIDVTPTVEQDEWSAEFTGLLEGTWLLRTFYENDVYAVELPIAVFAQGF